MKMNLMKTLGSSAAIALLSGSTAFAYECIAPANPGGGWDFTCRQIANILYEIKAIDAPMQVTNMAGAGGGVADGRTLVSC